MISVIGLGICTMQLMANCTTKIYASEGIWATNKICQIKMTAASCKTVTVSGYLLTKEPVYDTSSGICKYTVLSYHQSRLSHNAMLTH